MKYKEERGATLSLFFFFLVQLFLLWYYQVEYIGCFMTNIGQNCVETNKFFLILLKMLFLFEQRRFTIKNRA